MLRIAVLIPAAGSGARMRQGVAPQDQAGRPENKVLRLLGGEPMLLHAVRTFHALAELTSVRIVARREDFESLERMFSQRAHWPRLGPWVAGGFERQDSVRLGLKALAAEPEGPPQWVLVHDGARPLCSPDLVQRVLRALQTHTAVVPVLPVIDTVRMAQGEHSQGVLERANLRLSQTPQGFHWSALWRAHMKAEADGFLGTDDGQLVERLGERVALVPGERRNLKVTLAEDLAMAEWVLKNPGWGVTLF